MGTSVEAGHGKMAADLQMTALQDEAMGDSDLPLSDEVEELSKSLREAVQDQNVQPKLQCLMMDPSFSMVTVQSEDSNIRWETSFNPSSAPWMSAARPANVPNAGKIIFIMDEALTVRKKRTKKKEKKAAPPPEPESSLDVDEHSKRPAMVEVSTPNVICDEQVTESNTTDLTEQKELRLFRLISESTEILNIVVPPKVATVDEEESKVLVDNLAYMEDSPIVQPSDIGVFEQCPDADTSKPAPEPEATLKSPTVELPEDVAPPFKPPPTEPAHDSDYCSVFTLYDRQSTEDTEKKEEDSEAKPGEETKESEQAAPEVSTNIKETPNDLEHPVSSGELCSELLDDVFYGGTEESGPPESEKELPRGRTESSRSSRKESGSALFVEEDEVLTPIYLPDGPPKIIDPILLEEPKAMAFMYTDLYEEAVGTRKKDEDAVSLSSEKSFHSQQSDREDKGYLEKFVLKVEGPAVEGPSVQKTEAVPSVSVKEDGKIWSENVFELAKLGRPEDEPVVTSPPEEEVTDFFRDSNNSSPCEKVERPDVILEETVDNRTRQVKFAEEALKGDSKPAESTLEDPEKDLDPTILAELEELHSKQKSSADDKPSQQNIAETPAPSVEPQATDKPIRPFLELSTLQPVEPVEGMAERTVTEKGKEDESGDLQAKSCREEALPPPVIEGDKDVPPDSVETCTPDAPPENVPDAAPAEVINDPDNVPDTTPANVPGVAPSEVTNAPDNAPVAAPESVPDVVPEVSSET